MALRSPSLKRTLCSQRKDGLPNLKRPMSSTIIHHHHLATRELRTYIRLTIRLIIRNCNVNHQCDNGLNGDSGYVILMATSAMQVKITQCKQNLKARYFHALIQE